MDVASTYFIVGSGMSDIGKGWLTASLGTLAPERTLAVKIDPMFNVDFPQDIGVPVGPCDWPGRPAGAGGAAGGVVSDDLKTYQEAGLHACPSCNILAGRLIRRFLEAPPKAVPPDDRVKKLTISDLSESLVERLDEAVSLHPGVNRLLVEVGGTVDDTETFYVPSAVRLLARRSGTTVGIVLLSYFDFAEGTAAYRVKTQYIRRALQSAARTYYGVPLIACFARRRHVPEWIEDCVLETDLRNAGFETQVATDRLFLLPNRSSVAGVAEFLRSRCLERLFP